MSTADEQEKIETARKMAGELYKAATIEVSMVNKISIEVAKQLITLAVAVLGAGLGLFQANIISDTGMFQLVLVGAGFSLVSGLRFLILNREHLLRSARRKLSGADEIVQAYEKGKTVKDMAEIYRKSSGSTETDNRAGLWGAFQIGTFLIALLALGNAVLSSGPK